MKITTLKGIVQASTALHVALLDLDGHMLLEDKQASIKAYDDLRECYEELGKRIHVAKGQVFAMK